MDCSVRRCSVHVVVVNDFGYVNGGAASVAITSALGLARRGHGVTYFSAVGPVDERLASKKIHVVCLSQHEILTDPSRLRAIRQGIWNPQAARELALILGKLDPRDTIVHVHGWCKALSSSVVRSACDRDFRVVCTLHDYFVACPNGGFYDYSSSRHCHLTPLSPSCVTRNCDARSYSHKLWRVARQVAQTGPGRIPSGISAFIVLSNLSQRILGPYLPEDARLFKVPNPVEAQRWDPVDVGRNCSFVMLGRLSPEKGCVLFARVARECRVRALFVGDGPSRPAIAEANPGAVITGWLSRSDTQERLAEARALVFPSLWYEAQPLAVLEAMSRGVPPVVSDDCAAAERVEHGVTGLLFKGGDAVSLASALRRLQDGNVVRELGRCSYESYWADPLTVERHVEGLERVYDEVLAGHCAQSEFNQAAGDGAGIRSEG